MSIGLVNYAIKKLEEIGCIIKKIKGFEMVNPKKSLVYWASIHKLNIEKKFHVDKGVDEIEKSLPYKTRLTAFSGAKIYYNIYPADYSEVYVYCDVNDIKDRFDFGKGKENLIVLKKDEHLFKFKKTPLAQIFVDLWNINTWYAKDFLKNIGVKIDGILAGLGN